MNIKELSIIIVNYNGSKYLENCIDSIYKYCNSIDFEIIIVDNNSIDNSVVLLNEKYPDVKLIESKINLGFAGGNNLGVSRSNSESILLLNNDTILLQDISTALKELKDPETAVIGVKMLNGNKKYIPSLGKFPNALSLIKFSNLEENREEFITGKFTKTKYSVDWVTGAFFLTKKHLWNKVNGLDEDYFMYVEDVDFCKKIKNLGKKIIFISNIEYIHFVGFNKTREIKLINGYKIYARKHFNFVNYTIAKMCLNINYGYKKIFKNIR